MLCAGQGCRMSPRVLPIVESHFREKQPVGIAIFINSGCLEPFMPTAMDRGLGDSAYRKMERLKQAREAGLPLPRQHKGDIEEPIVVASDDQ